MAINVKDKLVTVEGVKAAFDIEAEARDNADQALSDRIDNIVAPEGVPSLSEVSDARTNKNGTVYNTLKARLDADASATETEISKINGSLDAVDAVMSGLPSNLYKEDISSYLLTLTETAGTTRKLVAKGATPTEVTNGSMSSLYATGLSEGGALLVQLASTPSWAYWVQFFIFVDTNGYCIQSPTEMYASIKDLGLNHYLMKVPEGAVGFWTAAPTASVSNVSVYAFPLADISEELPFYTTIPRDALPSGYNNELLSSLARARILFSENLVTQTVEGSFVRDNGTIGTTSNMSYIVAPVSDNAYYLITPHTNPTTGNNILAFFDAGGNLVRERTTKPYNNYVQVTSTDYIVLPPSGAATLYLTVTSANAGCTIKRIDINDYFLAGLKIHAANLDDALSGIIGNLVKYKYSDSLARPFSFSGKTLVAFGDSITAGVCSGESVSNAGDDKYLSVFADAVGLTVDNRAIGGSRITHVDGVSNYIVDLVTAYTGTPDFILIAGGVNDYAYGMTVGSYNSTDITTFYGALRAICESIAQNQPNATVIFITPINCMGTFSGVNADINVYRNAIYEIATLYGCNVVDGTTLGFADDEGEWMNNMIPDKLHPSIAGHHLYAKGLMKKLC